LKTVNICVVFSKTFFAGALDDPLLAEIRNSRSSTTIHGCAKVHAREGIVAIGAMQNVQTRCAGNAKMEHTCGKEGDPYK
jgi:hypothetical protein